MTMVDDETYRLFDRLLVLLESCFSGAELAEVRNFYDVNELGLAFEAVEDTFDRQQHPPSAEVSKLMTRLGELMELPYPAPQSK